jgi:hypothetical protein
MEGLADQHHLGFFQTEVEARARIESEILKRMRQFEPIWAKFWMLQSQHVVSRLPLQCSLLVKSSKTARTVHRRRTAA